jgi:hypothetical protein
MFSFRFDWQCDEDPPDVYIVSPEGYDVLQVFERLTYWDGEKTEDDSWRIGPFTKSVLSAINVAHSAKSIVYETGDLTDASGNNVGVPESIVRGETHVLKFDIEGFR